MVEPPEFILGLGASLSLSRCTSEMTDESVVLIQWKGPRLQRETRSRKDVEMIGLRHVHYITIVVRLAIRIIWFQSVDNETVWTGQGDRADGRAMPALGVV